MRILIVSNSYPTHKNPTRQCFIRSIENGLKRAGHQTKLIYNRYFDLFESPLETGSVLTGVIKALFFILSSFRAVLFTCRKVDIIYSHAPLLPGFLMMVGARLHGIPHVTYAHGSVNQYAKKKGLSYKLAAYTMQNCTQVFTNSIYMQKKLLEHYSIQSVVVTPGYNHRVFYYRDVEKTTDILFAGNCIHRKGLHIFLHAIRTHNDWYRRNNIRVTIHCSGKLRPDAEHFCKRNQLEDLISFGDKLEERELAHAYCRTKLVVYPSLDEPLGLVGIEAIACGAFLIASNVGGIPEYVQQEETGLLFEPGNSQALQQAIERAINEQLWKQPTERLQSRQQALKPFTIEHGTRQAINHFKKMIKPDG